MMVRLSQLGQKCHSFTFERLARAFSAYPSFSFEKLCVSLAWTFLLIAPVIAVGLFKHVFTA